MRLTDVPNKKLQPTLDHSRLPWRLVRRATASESSERQCGSGHTTLMFEHRRPGRIPVTMLVELGLMSTAVTSAIRQTCGVCGGEVRVRNWRIPAWLLAR